ncbi:MAG TPA: hypothetical protein PLA03_12600 [Acidobacteriota bacterium]|nr:hypothetical protein [Acidobacteriota bacterium]HNT17831.1 hypothetical protein [Acidobacteriota bacterium]HQO21183.1 hypothetical protein [Acidobacteriota bacterium]
MKKRYSRPRVQGKKKIVNVEKDKLEAQYMIEIDHILDSRTEFFSSYPSIRAAYKKHYENPQLDTLRHEVCLCLLFGLYQAAITATNHLLESFMKNILMHYLSRPWRNEDLEKTPAGMMQSLERAHKRVDNLNLETTINMACKLTLITKEDKEQLKKLKGPFRDAYSHASKEKLLGNETVTVFPVTMSNEGKFQRESPLQVPVGVNPIIAPMAQLESAKAQARDYFLYIDNLIRRTLEKLYSEEPPKNNL